MFAFELPFTVCTTGDAINSICRGKTELANEFKQYWLKRGKKKKKIIICLFPCLYCRSLWSSVCLSKTSDLTNKRKCFWNRTSLTYLCFHCASFFFSPFLLPAADCCASNLCSRLGMFVSFSLISFTFQFLMLIIIVFCALDDDLPSLGVQKSFWYNKQ